LIIGNIKKIIAQSLFKPLIPQKDPLLIGNNAFFDDFDQNKPLEAYSFVVFDTELTGFNPKKDEIVSIGALKISGLKIIPNENFYVIVRPRTKELQKDSTLIHRLTPQVLEKAPYIDEVLHDFVKFCYGSLLVGHFIDLDMSFIDAVTKKIMHDSLENPCIDTLRLAIRHREKETGYYEDRYKMSGSYSLDDISRENKLPVFPAHDALQDAFQTAYLFLALVKKLQKRGVHTLKDLYLAGKAKIGF